MIELATTFPVVVITGPERSGTTLASRVFAHELGYRRIREEEWDNDFSKAWRILNENTRIVLHAPHLTYRIHNINKRCKDRVLTVFMWREDKDIIASQTRIGWGKRSGHGDNPRGWGKPTSRWYDAESYEQFKSLILPDAPLCHNRKRVWDLAQKEQVRHWITLQYEVLKAHSLWDPHHGQGKGNENSSS